MKNEGPFTLRITPDNNDNRVDNRNHDGETFHYLECGLLQREFTVWSEESNAAGTVDLEYGTPSHFSIHLCMSCAVSKDIASMTIVGKSWRVYRLGMEHKR